MTTQADPPSETQQLADARIAIAQSMVRIEELEEWLTKYRAENDRLRGALASIAKTPMGEYDTDFGDTESCDQCCKVDAIARLALEKAE